MVITGLDGKEYKWNLNGYLKKRVNSSSYHKLARRILKEEFSMIPILEEVAIPGCGKRKLFADFYIPRKKIMIEVQGEQHYEYNPHFHGNPRSRKFAKAQHRDSVKREWCDINGIILIELSYKEKENVWRNKIRLRIGSNEEMGDGS